MPKVLARRKADRLRQERSTGNVKDCELGSRFRKLEGQPESDCLRTRAAKSEQSRLRGNERSARAKPRLSGGVEPCESGCRMPARAPVTKPDAESVLMGTPKDHSPPGVRFGGLTANGDRHRTPSVSWSGRKAGLPEGTPQKRRPRVGESGVGSNAGPICFVGYASATPPSAVTPANTARVAMPRFTCQTAIQRRNASARRGHQLRLSLRASYTGKRWE